MKKKQRLRRRFMFFTYIFLCVIAILFLMFATTESTCKETEKAYLEHYVMSGDTLDGIYYQYEVNEPLLKWRYAVMELNNKQTSELLAGEVIKVYVDKEDKQ